MPTRRLKAVVEGKDQGATALFGKLKGAIGALGIAAIAVGSIAIGKKLVKGLADATRFAGIQEAAQVKLGKALALSGQNAAKALPELQAYASGLQDITGAGDEAILAAQSLLVSIGKLSGDVLKDATVASLDLAAAIGVDERTAFDLVAKAASGYTGTLSRYGIILDESTPKSEKFAEVLETINAQFGGQAAAQLETFEGRMKEFQGRVGDLKEVIGGPFLEATKAILAKGISPFIKKLTSGVGAFKPFRDGVLLAAEAMARFADITVRALKPIVTYSIVLGAFAIQKFTRDLELATDAMQIFGSFFTVGTEETLFGRVARELEDIRINGPKALSGLDAALAGPRTQIDLFDDTLKSLGLTMDKDLRRQASEVKLAFDELIALDATGVLSPERYEVIAAALEEMAAKIIEEGGVVAGFTQAHAGIISIDEALQLVVDGGFAALQAAIEDTGRDVGDLGADLNRNLRGIGVGGALALGDTLVDAAFGADVSFGEFFKNLAKDISKAIVQALILKAILGVATGGAGAALSGGGIIPIAGSTGLSQGGRIPGQRGLLIPGADTGRDRVPAILRPGELVFPRELSDFILSLAGGGGGAGSNVSIELRSDLPLFIERVNTQARQGSVRVVATELATTRRIR